MAQVDRDNLRALIADSGKSPRAISLEAGLGATAVKDILSGKSRDPGAGTLAKIAEVLGVSVGDLLDGADVSPVTNLTQVKLAPRLLQVRYRVKAGRWFEPDTEEPPEKVAHPVHPHPRFAAFSQWLELVDGDSVDLEIPPGHYAHVVDAAELGYAAKSGDLVVVERRRDGGAVRERTIKQVERQPDGQVRLVPRSSNPKWSGPVEVPDGDPSGVEVAVVGLVIGAYRDFKVSLD